MQITSWSVKMLLITADIHSSTTALKAITDIARSKKVKQVLIAGDLCPPTNPLFMRYLGRLPTLTLVRGNSDNTYHFAQARMNLPPLVQTLAYQGRTITLTHGHIEVPFAVGGVVVTAHTHIPHLHEDEKGTLWVNPGSPSTPRSDSGPTYALLDSEGVGIYHLNDHSLLLYHRFTSS